MSEKGFKYSILASGSSGNSFYLETPKKKILVDAGLSGKKITSLLAEINRKPEDLDAILITHEHSDHIHGVGVLARKYGMDLYANEKTWQAMENSKYLGKVDSSQKHIFEMGKTKTFGDIDIRDVSQKELRNRIGYVPQKGILFSGTIASNLRYADENLSDKKMEEALSISQAKEFVERMPNGVDEPIAQGGTNVSGGQKQRLSIARALAKDAQVYIFDDTFSALDYATDAKLRTALAGLIAKKHATVFIVAQRISSIMHADKIIVLDQGRMAGIGTHEALLKNCEVYQEIAHSQLSREELGE